MAKEESLFEIITVNELKELYINTDTLVMPPYKLYHLSTIAGRLYFTTDANGHFDRAYIGSTNIGKMIPMEKSLLQWYCTRGFNEAVEYMRQRSVYGTAFHSYAAQYFNKKTFSTKHLNEDLTTRMREANIPLWLMDRGHEGKKGWAEEMRLDIAALDKWIQDYDVTPIAVEIPLKSDIHGVGTLVDFVGFSNDYNYTDKTPVEQRKQSLIIADFKSGKSGFYKAHKMQLEACHKIWEENFPNLPPVKSLYNFAPKDFRGTEPTYSFTNQTDKIDAEEYDIYLILAQKKMKEILERPVRIIDGTIEFKKANKMVVEMSLMEVLQSGLWENYLVRTELIA